MSVVTGDALLVKGAPDAVLPAVRRVPRVPPHGGRASWPREACACSRSRRATARRAARRCGGDAERDLELLGLVGLRTRRDRTSPSAIAACRRAGIRVAMVTGDHPATAAAIAREVGLATPDGLVLHRRRAPRRRRACSARCSTATASSSRACRPRTSCASPGRSAPAGTSSR